MGKILAMSLLLKLYQKKEKAPMEMRTHRSLAHQHTMGFRGIFKYKDLVSEPCCWRSQGRKALTEPEAAITSLDASTCTKTGFITGTSSWANSYSVRIWRRN